MTVKYRNLARNIEFGVDLPSLANAVRRFHDIELSWDEIRDLAGPYIVKRRKLVMSFAITKCGNVCGEYRHS